MQVCCFYAIMVIVGNAKTYNKHNKEEIKMARTRKNITKDITVTEGNVSYFDGELHSVGKMQFNGKLDTAEFREKAEETPELQGKQVIVTELEHITNRYVMPVAEFIKYAKPLAVQLTMEEISESEETL